MALGVDIDVDQASIKLHLDKSLRQLSSSRLVNRRMHAYHSVIALALLHPTLIILSLFIVLRIRSMSWKSSFHHKQWCYRSYGNKATPGMGSNGTRSTRKYLTRETAVVKAEKRKICLMVLIHQRLIVSGDIDVGSKDRSTRLRLTLETTVVECVYVEKGEMNLMVIINQRLVMSGDVELNPGPLGVLDLRTVTNELGSVMAKWFPIGVQLGIDQAKLQEIEINYRTADRCFSEVINFWLKGNTPIAVRWKSLVEVLESPFVGEKGLARGLREKGGMSETVEVPAGIAEGGVQTQEINGGRRGKKRPAEEKLDDNGEQHHGGSEAKKAKLATDAGSEKAPGAEVQPIDKPQPLPRLTFPMLDQIMEISSEEKEHLKQRLYSESVEIMHKFQKLFSSTIKSLKERKVTVKELLNHIRCLGALEPVYIDSEQGCLRQELREKKMESIDDVMEVVNEYSSFFNYHMIENIIDHLGGEEDKRNLTKYLQDFTEYASKRKVFECPCEVGTINENGRSNMFVTLDKSYDNCTISSLKNFERELAKILNVSSNEVVILCRIAPGSLQLIFQIPLAIQKAIFPLSSEQEVALSQLGVLHLSCGDYQFTNELKTAEDTGDHSSEDGDSDTEKQSTAADTDLSSVIGNAGVIAERGNRKKGGSSVPDSGFGTSTSISGRSIVTGDTFPRLSRFEDLMLRDLQDEPFLRMEAELHIRPTPDDRSSVLELHWAAYNGELDRVKQLIEDKELNPLQANQDGNNVLHYTAGGGHLPVMKYLIEDQGLNPACQGRKDLTPLHLAAWCKHLELVKYLVDVGQVDPLCQNEHGLTPLHLACWAGDIDIIQYLISEMKKHTSLDSIVYDRTKDGNTAVHIAALWGNLPVVKLFITELNFDANTPGFMGRPPLVGAAQGGHLELVRYLIEEQQCDPSYAPGEEKQTPLHLAAVGGHLDVISYLTLTRKCSPLIRNSYGNAPLHSAVLKGRYETVKFFVSELQCDPSTPGQWGRTPPHDASQEGHLNIVQYLIDERKCNPTNLDNRKTTPLHLATVKGHLHIVKYLIEEKNCNTFCYDMVFGTPLHWAAVFGQMEVIKYLVEVHKCPVNIRGQDNMTPLEMAHHRGHTHVVEYLSSFK